MKDERAGYPRPQGTDRTGDPLLTLADTIQADAARFL